MLTLLIIGGRNCTFWGPWGSKLLFRVLFRLSSYLLQILGEGGVHPEEFARITVHLVKPCFFITIFLLLYTTILSCFEVRDTGLEIEAHRMNVRPHTWVVVNARRAGPPVLEPHAL